MTGHEQRISKLSHRMAVCYYFDGKADRVIARMYCLMVPDPRDMQFSKQAPRSLKS